MLSPRHAITPQWGVKRSMENKALTPFQVSEIRRKYKRGISRERIAIEFHVSTSTIRRLLIGKTYTED